MMLFLCFDHRASEALPLSQQRRRAKPGQFSKRRMPIAALKNPTLLNLQNYLVTRL
jgi:hypothetical protein